MMILKNFIRLFRVSVVLLLENQSVIRHYMALKFHCDFKGVLYESRIYLYSKI